MKTFWDIDINNKIAALKDNNIKFKIKFDIEIRNDYLVIKQEEVLEKDFPSNLNSEELSKKMAKLMSSLGDELNYLHLKTKLGDTKLGDINKIKMYQVEDNIYVSEDRQICVLNPDGFYGTDYVTSLPLINEEIATNLVKLSIYDYDDLVTIGDYEIDLDDNTINDTKFIYEIEDDYEYIRVNDSFVYVYDEDEIDEGNIKKEDKELIELLIKILINGYRNHITFNELKENIKYISF